MKKLLATLGLAAFMGMQGFSQVPASTVDYRLMEYYVGREAERAVIVADDTINNITLFSSSIKTVNNTRLISELVQANDTLLHAHNHSADIELHARWGDQKKIGKALERMDKEVLEGRLLCELPSVMDFRYMLSIEHPGMLNGSVNEFAIYVTQNNRVKPVYYGLTDRVKEEFSSLPKEEQFAFLDSILFAYRDLFEGYFEEHCSTWETGKCEEPSYEELKGLIEDQGLIFIEERRGMTYYVPQYFRKWQENNF